MCFVLYIGTDEPVSSIPWDEQNRNLNTQDLREHDSGVVRHFEKPHVKHVGSDQGCGCGFRHVLYQNGEWPEEAMIGNEHYTGEVEQPNHVQLHAFLAGQLEQAEEVELYGCWDGDFTESSEGSTVLSIDRILDRGFFFRERFGYKIVKGKEKSQSDSEARLQ